MNLVADGLLLLAALTSGLYCIVLARRLKRLNQTDEGIGQKIHALGVAVEETRAALDQTQSKLEEMRREALASSERMARETARARRLADDLARATGEADRTLDALYRAERRIGRVAAPAESMNEDIEIEEEPESIPAPKDQDEAGQGEVVMDEPSPSRWQGDDVLKAGRA